MQRKFRKLNFYLKKILTRFKVLDVLKAYAAALGEIMANYPLDEFGEQTKKLVGVLKRFTKDDDEYFFEYVTRRTEADIDVLITAVNSIGRAIINHKQDQEMREIIAELNPHVDQLKTVMEQNMPRFDELKKKIDELYCS